MKRLFNIVFAILLLFMLTGCFEKDFDKDSIVLRGAKALNFEVGESKTVKAELPQLENSPTLIAICENEELTATISDDNSLTLASDTAGDYVVMLRLEAKGYNPLEVKYPVSVTLKTMDITIASQDGNSIDISQGISLNKDDTQMLHLSGAPDDAKYSVQSSDSSVITADLEGSSIKLNAVTPGKTTILIVAEKDGYKPFSAELPVTVEKTAAILQLSQQSVSGTTNQTLQLSCTQYQQGGQISISANDPAVSAALNGNIINISSTKAGNYSVSVSCAAEGYHTTTKTVSAIFSMPTVPFYVPSSVSIAVGETKDINVTGFPNGTTISVTGSGNSISASYNNATISIEGKTIGSSSITINATCAGYSDSKVTIPVTVSGISLSVSNKYSDYAQQIFNLTNQERTSRGLSKLSYISSLEGACQLRAKEASIVWDHTRPDGRSWDSVLDDIGYSYYSAGENLFASNALDAELAVDSWMNSEGHRANILRAEFDSICIGVVKGDDGEYYYTQIFIKRN